MILADANIVIAATRPKGAALKAKIGTLPVVIAGVVRCEMIGGSETPTQRARAMAVCDGYLESDFKDEHWVALCVPLPDVIVATLSIANGIEVWSNDKHFPLMQAALPALELFAEPV